MRGAREHNLRDVTVDLPLGTLIACDRRVRLGQVLADARHPRPRRPAALLRQRRTARRPRRASRAGSTWTSVVTIDQTAIGRTPRSNAATYTGAFTPIRQAFAATEQARGQGLQARHFSFNVPGGRCERCKGAGLLTINMHFLPEALVRCPTCHGRRFKREMLAVLYRGADIADVLDMTIDEALGPVQRTCRRSRPGCR